MIMFNILKTFISFFVVGSDCQSEYSTSPSGEALWLELFDCWSCWIPNCHPIIFFSFWLNVSKQNALVYVCKIYYMSKLFCFFLVDFSFFKQAGTITLFYSVWALTALSYYKPQPHTYWYKCFLICLNTKHF